MEPTSTEQNRVAAVILAAGLGKRMKSDLPKVLHQLRGRFVVDYVIDNVKNAGVTDIVLVIGHKHELVRESLADRGVRFALQIPQRGTGDAVRAATTVIDKSVRDLLVLCGDMPLVSSSTISSLLQMRRQTQAAAVVLTAKLNDPGKYGRIVRDKSGFLEAIVEYADATEQVRQINEVNTGAYCFLYRELLPILERLSNMNAQGEFYLTDTIKLFRQNGLKVAAMLADDPNEGLGVNSLEELRSLELLLAKRACPGWEQKS